MCTNCLSFLYIFYCRLIILEKRFCGFIDSYDVPVYLNYNENLLLTAFFKAINFPWYVYENVYMYTVLYNSLALDAYCVGIVRGVTVRLE